MEYISQITDTEDNIFFNLTVKDAIMYVYTRTLFDINKTYLKDNNMLELDFLNDYLIFVNMISSLLIRDTDYKIKLKNIIDFLKNTIDKDNTLETLNSLIDNFKINIQNNDNSDLISYFYDKKVSN